MSAFFGAESDKGREELRNRYRSKLETWRTDAAHWNELEDIVLELRGGEKPVPPLHWEIEFPEVFARTNPGFNVFVGNPPFMAGRDISGVLSAPYLGWIKQSFVGAGGQADIVAYFFQRAFALLRETGSFGLLATNTIAQGDTRTASLRQITSAGGSIYQATKRLPWPGRAAVVVSVVHVVKGTVVDSCVLNGQRVEEITAFLLRMGPSTDPFPLSSNSGRAFKGVMIAGPGFLFDDRSSGASPLNLANELLTADSHFADIIKPYLGGEEMLNHPKHLHRRYVIDFDDMNEDVARQWPELMLIVEEKVRPEREGGRLARHPWWRFERTRPEMRRAVGQLSRVIMHPYTSSHLAFAFVPSSTLVATPHVIVALASFSPFAVLQGRIHEVWARLTSSTFKDDLSYKVSDTFETFPAPPNWQADSALETVGKAYYEFRADLMVRNDEGLTKTYNRFHDPEERDSDILSLRELHAEMDRAVLNAYGWTGISTDCEFLLDYEIDEETWGTKKKPYRYRWPEQVHDEVLARLLDLNQKRYAEEVAAGLHAEKGTKRSASKKTQRGTAASANAAHPLFGSAMKPSEEV